MPLLLLGLALLAPRLLGALIYLLSDWFTGMFTSGWWLLAGLVFLPTSLLWYSVVYHWFGGNWEIIPIVGMIISLVIDLAPARKREAVELAAS